RPCRGRRRSRTRFACQPWCLRSLQRPAVRPAHRFAVFFTFFFATVFLTAFFSPFNMFFPSGPFPNRASIATWSSRYFFDGLRRIDSAITSNERSSSFLNRRQHPAPLTSR